ncbi:36.4 kDa proline-rich protein-like precursor [Iris pallida]|uniref:36.4 kDa proline-rich protein-like n=1 Tax=Iris pallida TaxID=29817 RepID=A0AAX6HR58_IRIPA|nr:36.4 kDa proline-rich protein-like precursor [Iris pallida]KAJ6843577.1 36.4 kDa proline-rich protein-like precursor [Iris pallida]KAJ6843578.1 36.4 kDa proline-rich protein-like precursor [Iris pallida]KAJ6843579.1 36.4 kDa proline-rich protein-like precursor [Iris pallida]
MRFHTLLPILLIIVITLSSLLPSYLACPTCPTPKSPPPPPPKAKPCPPPPPSPKPKTPPPPKAPTPHCPINTLKLDLCVDVLSGLVHGVVGGEATRACCPVISGLADLDAALCLCTAIRAKLLDISILLPVALELLVDCGKHAPFGYQCPA